MTPRSGCGMRTFHPGKPRPAIGPTVTSRRPNGGNTWALTPLTSLRALTYHRASEARCDTPLASTLTAAPPRPTNRSRAEGEGRAGRRVAEGGSLETTGGRKSALRLTLPFATLIYRKDVITGKKGSQGNRPKASFPLKKSVAALCSKPSRRVGMRSCYTKCTLRWCIRTGFDRVNASFKSSLRRQGPIQVSRDTGFLETWMDSRLRGKDLLLMHGIILSYLLQKGG